MLANLKGVVVWPPPFYTPIVTGTPFLVTVNLSGDKAGFTFRAPKTGNLRKIGWRTATVTTGATIDVRLETVDLTTGAPSGTLFAANTNASQVVADADDNKWFLNQLTADAAVTKGDRLGISLVTDGGNLQIKMAEREPNPQSNRTLYPQCWDGSTGVYTAMGVTAVLPCIYIEYDDASSAWIGGFPSTSVALATFNSGSNPDERGLVLTMRFRARATGVWVAGGSFGGDYDLALYNNVAAVIADVSVDADEEFNQPNGVGFFFFDAGVAVTAELVAGQTYYLMLKPTTVTDVSLLEATLETTVFTAAKALYGQTDVAFSSRVDGGSFTAGDNSLRPLMGLLLDQLDDGTGGAGAAASGDARAQIFRPRWPGGGGSRW